MYSTSDNRMVLVGKATKDRESSVARRNDKTSLEQDQVDLLTPI
jgi:hypothetical protein